MSKMLKVREHFQIHVFNFLDTPNEMSESLIFQEMEYYIEDMLNLTRNF